MCLFTIHISPKLSVTLGMTNKSKNLFENSVTSLVPCGVSSQLKQDRPVAYILNRCTAQTAPCFLATAAAQPLLKEEKSDQTSVLLRCHVSQGVQMLRGRLTL